MRRTALPCLTVPIATTAPTAAFFHRLLARTTTNIRRPYTSSSPTMKYNKLGSSDILVSHVCLGTMTFGIQNTEQQAHEQIDYAYSRGINFIDTAEIYPVPGSHPAWQPGRTEQYIGTYFANHPDRRKHFILATKVSGYNSSSKTVAYRSDPPLSKPYPPARHDRQSILSACDASLRRLHTDYIDLYQLHWPDRYVPVFGVRAYNPKFERDAVQIRDILLALKELLDQRKIRAYGLSNETTFGVTQFVHIADQLGMPRPATIQNSFCLLDRRFESELAEACAPSNFNVGLLPWSILGGGALSGKYLDKVDSNLNALDDSVNNCRLVKFPGYMHRYLNEPSTRATRQYAQIAKKHGMSLATLAQAFCRSRWFIPSSIVGATTIEQLKENIDAFEVDLSEQILQEIDAVHKQAKDPCID